MKTLTFVFLLIVSTNIFAAEGQKNSELNLAAIKEILLKDGTVISGTELNKELTERLFKEKIKQHNTEMRNGGGGVGGGD